MNITVIGVAGRLGQQIATVAAARGHLVTGLCRRAVPANGPAGAARLVIGDARDRQAVDQAVAGADAVVCAVSGGTSAQPHQAEQVATALVASMQASGVRRLVTTSAYRSSRPVPAWP